MTPTAPFIAYDEVTNKTTRLCAITFYDPATVSHIRVVSTLRTPPDAVAPEIVIAVERRDGVDARGAQRWVPVDASQVPGYLAAAALWAPVLRAQAEVQAETLR